MNSAPTGFPFWPFCPSSIAALEDRLDHFGVRAGLGEDVVDPGMVFNVSTDARDRIDSVPEDARRTGEFVTVFDHALFERTLESESDPLGDVLELEGSSTNVSALTAFSVPTTTTSRSSTATNRS